MAKQKMIDVPLFEPIKRGEETIDKLTLRRPAPGELRGLTVTAIVTMDVDAMLKLLPRVVMPAVTEAEIAALDPFDFGELCGHASGFFTTSPREA